jgi:polysaccharide biosynthesis/export protein
VFGLTSYLATSLRWASAVATAMVLVGCASISSTLPGSGPSVETTTSPEQLRTHGIRLVEVTPATARELADARPRQSLVRELGAGQAKEPRIGVGDVVEVALWEAPPATLFSGAVPDVRVATGSRGLTLPEQTIGANGTLRVPFAGLVPVLQRTPGEIEEAIVARLSRMANQPQALVRVVRPQSSAVTVVGEVNQNARLPLSARGERVLDVLASAGGVKGPLNKMTIQVTRDGRQASVPLERLIRDAGENIQLQAGDVVTALHRPHAFTALGATGRNEEIEFEATGITLAQALGRTGGLSDQRADRRGVFVFRMTTSADGTRTPTVFQADLADPSSFFAAQSFPIEDRDILYVANAPAAELQKFLNLLLPLIGPATLVTTAVR